MKNILFALCLLFASCSTMHKIDYNDYSIEEKDLFDLFDTLQINTHVTVGFLDKKNFVSSKNRLLQKFDIIQLKGYKAILTQNPIYIKLLHNELCLHLKYKYIDKNGNIKSGELRTKKIMYTRLTML